jgi:hypothetical protein
MSELLQLVGRNDLHQRRLRLIFEPIVEDTSEILLLERPLFV